MIDEDERRVLGGQGLIGANLTGNGMFLSSCTGLPEGGGSSVRPALAEASSRIGASAYFLCRLLCHTFLRLAFRARKTILAVRSCWFA
jgi:hypothetical protein